MMVITAARWHVRPANTVKSCQPDAVLNRQCELQLLTHHQHFYSLSTFVVK